MATQFIDIYSRAMTLLKSPVLSRLQDNDLYSFCLIMNQYLKTAITFYNPNIATQSRLEDVTEAEDFLTTFQGDGVTTQFTIASSNPPSAESIIKVCINDRIIHKYTYDYDTNTLTFLDDVPLPNDIVSIYWLNDGYFGSITSEDVTLLAIAMCWAWAIQTQNNLLDIDRQPNDSDFKLHAEGTTLNAKVDWVKHYEEMYKRELSKADWRPFFRKGR